MNTIEAALAAPLASVNSAGNAFSQEQRSGGAVLSQRPAGKSVLVLGPSPEETLQKAWVKIRTLRARLAAIGAPPAAGHLRVLLLQLIDREASMTREVAELVAFLPSYTTALGALGPATRQLEAVLSQRAAYGVAAVSAVYASKAAALRRFEANTGALLAQLQRLRPPPVSRPGYAARRARSGNGRQRGPTRGNARVRHDIQRGTRVGQLRPRRGGRRHGRCATRRDRRRSRVQLESLRA